MNNKIFILLLTAIFAMFGFGAFEISHSVGRLGVPGFIGYCLCALSILFAICITVTFIVFRIEEKKDER